MELSGPLIWSTYSYELVLTISIRGLPDSAVLSSWTAEAAGFEAGCHNLKAAGLWGVGRKRMVHGDPWPYVECMYIYIYVYIWISMECRLFPWYYWYLCGFRTKSYWNLWWYPSLYTYLAIWIMGICISSSSGHRKESITNYINLIKHGYDWNLR